MLLSCRRGAGQALVAVRGQAGKVFVAPSRCAILTAHLSGPGRRVAPGSASVNRSGSDLARGSLLSTDGGGDPLRTDDPVVWDRLLEAVNPASVLVVIETRMNPALRRRVTPEDIWQDTLLHVWRDREKCVWQGLRRFRAWVLAVAENRIREAVTRERAQKRGGGAEELSLSVLGGGDTTAAPRPFPGPVGSTTPSRIAIHREQAAAMKAALQALPEEVREVVHLRLFEQMAVNQIAGQLGIGESAVRHRFRKGSELYQRRLVTEFASRSTKPPE